MPDSDVPDLIDSYATLLPQLARARTAYIEACRQEVLTRAQTLRVRLEAAEPVTATNAWADIDSATWTAEKLRLRAEMDNLADRVQMVRDLLALPPGD